MNKRVHFIGIGGIGVSALAQWFLHQGYSVSGSDIVNSSIISFLRKKGVRAFIGHRASNVQRNLERVIASAAVTSQAKGYIELSAAKKFGIPVLSYAEAVSQLTKRYPTLAIAGAHGKSTTTALLSLTLVAAKMDPTVMVGTKLREFGSRGRVRIAEDRRSEARYSHANNFRFGRGKYLVLEADEHNDAFLHYTPFAAIITNIDREHLDYHKDLNGVKQSFLKFMERIQPRGILVVNRDSKPLCDLRADIKKICKAKNIRVCWYGIARRNSDHDDDNKQIVNRIRNVLKIFGQHNVSNAVAVYTLARALHIPPRTILSSLGKYRGSWRRMEYRGKLKLTTNDQRPTTAKVYDDYAHHPTEIRATLAGLRREWPKSFIICVFQPHQAARLALLFKDFVGAFDDASALVLLDLYRVPGRDATAGKVNLSKKLAQAIQRRLETVVHLPHPGKLRSTIENLIRHSQDSHRFADSHYIVVMMGAGDIYKYTTALVK